MWLGKLGDNDKHYGPLTVSLRSKRGRKDSFFMKCAKFLRRILKSCKMHKLIWINGFIQYDFSNIILARNLKISISQILKCFFSNCGQKYILFLNWSNVWKIIFDFRLKKMVFSYFFCNFATKF